ncbi:NAD(P)-binding protein [Mycolicibacterium llatzerense]|uniref:NAD(P)-binding protein n=1 Tax=Mycolicibacterium llatzerense TaxID=280871 RepID=UPI0021B617D2|nr:hypothetical protein [Mycolicibacterium llatzerense]MCT7363320.1 hypothetical protein [Mycolicibacterium llatzerense]
MNQPIPHNHVAIIGTGVGALAAAVRLHQSGIADVTLIDHADDEVAALHWQAVRQRWHITTATGERTAAHVVVDTDAPAEPAIRTARRITPRHFRAISSLSDKYFPDDNQDTGSETRQLPLTDRLFGADGVSMAESWNGEPVAYLGTSVHGFPNCYLMLGPNISVRHNSVEQVLESQANYIAASVTYARDFGFAAVEPTPTAQQNYTNAWQSSTADFRRRTSRFVPVDHLVQRPGRELVSAAVRPATESC